MVEEKEEKKKPGVVKRIFKWIGLGLLTVLIILGLIFQAPWKVITLFAVIFLACAVLPKPYRKYFWLSVAAVVIALIIWVFLPEEDEGWRPYTFDEELAAIEAKRAIPPEENAATIYNELFKSYDGYIFVYPDLRDKDIKEIKDLTLDEYSKLVEEAQPEDTFYPEFWNSELDYLSVSEPWSQEEYPELTEWLKHKESVIEALIQASQKGACRFAINRDTYDSEQTNHNLAMRRWACLLIRAANNDLGEGRINQGLEKYIAVLQMSKHLRQQPTILDSLVGMGVEALAIKQFNRFVVISDATQIHLSVIEEALAEIKHDWNSDLPRILECEKLKAKNMLGMFYEVNPKGKVRLSRNPTAAIRAQFPLPPPTYYQIKLAKAGTILGWFGMPSTPQKAGEIIDAAYERYHAMAGADFDWGQEHQKLHSILEKRSWAPIRFNFGYLVELIADMAEESYYGVRHIYLRSIATKRCGRIIIALRRYKNQTGFWPVNLNDVKSMAPVEIFVDPINGGDFVYEITEENFRLYSKGKNGIDEDGERDEIAGTDDWPIWPTAGKKRKAEKENTDAE